jgi:aspartate-semialdehyde dehydrogenase
MLSTKIRVGVLGCTGAVGMNFISLLDNHPWFEVAALGASSRSARKSYANACSWRLVSPMPESVANIEVLSASDDGPSAFRDAGCSIVFSALDASVAGDLEEQFARAGLAVFSNAKNWRMDSHVPLVVPTANAGHIDSYVGRQLDEARFGGDGGFIVTNPNCTTTGLVSGVQPLHDRYGLRRVMAMSMQAISGAGFPGMAAIDMVDNVVPFISGEEQKMESELGKILGGESGSLRISAHCNRVAVSDGHTICASIEFADEKPSVADIEETLRAFEGPEETRGLELPSMPEQLIHVHDAPDRPQPRLDRGRGNGFTTTVGRIRECPLFDTRLVVCPQNKVVCALVCAILNAEYATARNLVQRRSYSTSSSSSLSSSVPAASAGSNAASTAADLPPLVPPRRIIALDELRFRVPTLDENDGLAMHRIAKLSGVLETNTPYCYSLYVHHFGRDGCIIATHEPTQNEPVGYIQGHRPPDQPDTVFVWQIGVDVSVQAKGIGTELLVQLAKRLHDTHDVRYLEATVTPSNVPSCKMFRGFARRLGVPCTETSLFGIEHLTPQQSSTPHECENLFCIGPFDF